MRTSALTLATTFARTPANKAGVLSRISNWISVSRERGQLADLDARLLSDIGLTREDAQHEAMRPFWDVKSR